MINLRADPGLSRNRDQFVDGLDQLVALAANVRDVTSPVLCGDFAERNQLIGLRVERRCIDQRRPDTERALLHGGPDVIAHALQLVVGRRPIFESDFVDAHGRCADERSDIRRDPSVLEELQIFAQRGPSHVVLDVALPRG